MKLVHGMLVDFTYQGKEYKEVKVWEDATGLLVRTGAYSDGVSYKWIHCSDLTVKNLRRSKKFWPVLGDVLIDKHGVKRKVLGFCENVFFFSFADDYKRVSGSLYTIQELEAEFSIIEGIETEGEEKIVLTMDEIAKKFDVPVGKLRIEKGE